MFKKCCLLFFFSPCLLVASPLTWPYGNIHFLGDSHCGHLFTNLKTWDEFRTQKKAEGGNPFDPEMQYEKSYYHFHLEEDEIQIPFCTHWIGPRTTHRIGRDGINLALHGVTGRDIAVFVFGEIDVRVHIGKQRILFGRELDEIVDTLAKKYIRAISENQLKLGCQCIVLDIVPPCLSNFDIDVDPNKYVATVSLENRIEFTRKLNEKLSQECSENNITFLHVFDVVTNAEGSLSDFYRKKDDVHVQPDFNYLIKDQIIEYLFIPQSANNLEFGLRQSPAIQSS